MDYSGAESGDFGVEVPLVCVTGATGFIGSHILPLLLQLGVRVRVLTRSEQSNMADVDVFVGDLFDPASLVRFMQNADLLINLAQPSGALSVEEFLTGTSNLARASLRAGVSRVLHISTAMVIGVPAERVVTEETPVNPKSTYEKQKFRAEQVLRSELGEKVDFGILRPTAVFGAGGQNLLKLAGVIMGGSVARRRLLRFLHGKRRMHLVSVQDIADAILFLSFLPLPLGGNVFLVAADGEQANNYQAVDSILGTAMGKPLPASSFSIPGAILRLLLRLSGRSQADPGLVYDASKIRSWGYRPRSDFTSALQEFAELYMKKGGR